MLSNTPGGTVLMERARAPSPPHHFEFIAEPAAQASLRPGDLLPMDEVDFAVMAERYESPYSQLLEAVPLAFGFAPVKFVGEALGRISHQDQNKLKLP
jgi:hypothetical protein